MRPIVFFALVLGAATTANFVYLIFRSRETDWKICLDFNKIGEGPIEAILGIGLVALLGAAIFMEATSK